ncbi:hypothetical protein BYT27DRAFT_7340883 [Phlegmacium glaucopus]|nr:hypothetical protein BYT27DRAFT_7340883 [Phlegmacium glaucopus]
MIIHSYPSVALSCTDYGHHFHLGHGAHIPSTPTQRLQSFVEIEGSPYRFVVIGQLSSFEVAEDSFGHYLSVNLGHFEASSTFADTFSGQLDTLQKIEEEDRMDETVQAQYIQWRTIDGQLTVKTYDLSNYSLCSSDIGSFVLAIVELRCLDVSHGVSTFWRTYWSEALSLRALTPHNALDEQFVQNIIDHWQKLNPSIVSK